MSARKLVLKPCGQRKMPNFQGGFPLFIKHIKIKLASLTICLFDKLTYRSEKNSLLGR